MEAIDPKILISQDLLNTARFVEDMGEKDYHADRSSVGSSDLRLLIGDGSPKQFHSSFCLGVRRKVTESMRFGRLIHMAVLEGSKFREHHKVMPEFWGKTLDGKASQQSKESKALKASWLSAQPQGTVICTQDDIDTVTGILESIATHPQASRMLTNGRPEVSGFYVDEATRIKLKFRCDFLTFNNAMNLDLKSTVCCSAWEFGNSVFDLRYDVQLWMYGEGVKAITGKRPELNVVLAVEKSSPYEIAAYYFTPDDLRQAEYDYRRALTLLRKCIDDDAWPMRQAHMERVHTPQWFINRVINSEEMEG